MAYFCISLFLYNYLSTLFPSLSLSLSLSVVLFGRRAHKKSLKFSEASSRLLGWLTVLSHHRGFGQLATQVNRSFPVRDEQNLNANA